MNISKKGKISISDIELHNNTYYVYVNYGYSQEDILYYTISKRKLDRFMFEHPIKSKLLDDVYIFIDIEYSHIKNIHKGTIYYIMVCLLWDSVYELVPNHHTLGTLYYYDKVYRKELRHKWQDD